MRQLGVRSRQWYLAIRVGSKAAPACARVDNLLGLQQPAARATGHMSGTVPIPYAAEAEEHIAGTVTATRIGARLAAQRLEPDQFYRPSARRVLKSLTGPRSPRPRATPSRPTVPKPG